MKNKQIKTLLCVIMIAVGVASIVFGMSRYAKTFGHTICSMIMNLISITVIGADYAAFVRGHRLEHNACRKSIHSQYPLAFNYLIIQYLYLCQ